MQGDPPQADAVRPNPRVPPVDARRARPVVILHASFVLSGVFTTLLGPLLPVLASRWSLSDAQSGYLFAAQFTGSIAGVGLSGLSMPRLGYGRTLVVAFALISAGAVTLRSGPWFSGLIAVFVYGVGLGLSIPATNLYVSDLFPTRRAAALSVLNMVWGLGALASPGLTALALRGNHTSFLLLSLAGASAFTAVAFVSIGRTGSPHVAQPASDSDWASVHTGGKALLAAAALMFFLYVGTENAVNGWVGTYAKRLVTGGGADWLLAPACFWAALLAGRGLVPFTLRHTTEQRLSLGGLVLAGGGIAFILAAATRDGILLGALLSGLGLAPVFPVAIAALSHVFGQKASRVAGVTFAMAGLGGATVPWLVGALSTRSGSLRLALGVPLVCVAAMLALQFSSRWPRRRYMLG